MLCRESNPRHPVALLPVRHADLRQKKMFSQVSMSPLMLKSTTGGRGTVVKGAAIEGERKPRKPKDPTLPPQQQFVTTKKFNFHEISV